MSERICPHCRNPIYDDDALLCHFCGESLRWASRGAHGPIKYGRFKALMVLVALILIVGLILFGCR